MRGTIEYLSKVQQSGSDLGTILKSFLMVLYWFLYYLSKSTFFEKKRVPRPVLDRSWADLGRQRAPKGGLLGHKLG